MGKVRNSLILLATLICIGLTAFLPKITGWVQDTAALGQVSYGLSSAVELEIREDMPPLGKLSLLARRTGIIQVPALLAEMTQEEAEQAALDALMPYMDCGLMPETEDWFLEAQPILVQTEEEEAAAGVIWAVTATGDREGLLVVSLDIDDATGTLLRINFSCEYWGETDLEDCLSRFAQVYFAGLGLEGYERSATDDLKNTYIGDDAAGIRYRFGDSVYGEVNVDLYVYRYGFYVDTPYV